MAESDRHDTSEIYRKLTLRQLQREVPQIKWRKYLEEFLTPPITDDEPLVTYALPYFIEMGRIVNETDTRLIMKIKN